MAKYVKKPIPIEANRWRKNGDHPEDDCHLLPDMEGRRFLSEGKVVRYFRHPDIDGESICPRCGVRMHEHGWIDDLEGGHTVCPGDWVIKGVRGEFYACKPDIFEETYQLVE